MKRRTFNIEMQFIYETRSLPFMCDVGRLYIILNIVITHKTYETHRGGLLVIDLLFLIHVSLKSIQRFRILIEGINVL